MAEICHHRPVQDIYLVIDLQQAEMYGSRIVPGKKYILSGGRHLIMWRPPLNYVAAATYYLAAAT